MAIPAIPVFIGTSPDRNTQSAAAFTINSIEWLDYQLIQIDATNVTVDGINIAIVDFDAGVLAAAASAAASAASADDSASSATISQSNANFKGRWSDATGAATIPATYSNNSQTWQLLQDIADITADEPLPGASNWQVVNDVNMGNVRVSKLDNPILHLFKKNKIAEAINGNVSVTRGTIVKYVDRNGVVRTAAIDEPREESAGWLTEGVSENLALRSEEFDNAAWGKLGVTISINSTTAPDGTTTADTIIEDAGTITPAASQSMTAGTHTLSCYFKSFSGNRFAKLRFSGNVAETYFDLSNGTIAQDNFSVINSEIKPLANGWFRCSVTAAPSGSWNAIVSLSADLDGTYTGDGVSGVHAWGVQVEEISLASSYIATTTTSVPRDADDISAPSDENFVDAEGSIFLKDDVIGDTGTDQYLLEISDGTVNNRLALIRSSDKIRLLIVDGGVTQVDISTAFDMDPFTQYDIAVNYKDNDVELFVGGVSIGADVSATMPRGLTIVNHGRSISGDELFGHLQDLRFYDFRLNLDEIKYLGGI